MLASALVPTGEIGKVGSNAAGALASEGPLGALVVLLLIAVGLLVWLLYKSKDHHIKDKDTMIILMKDQSIEVQGLLKDNKIAIDNMTKEVAYINGNLTKLSSSVNNLNQQWQMWQIVHNKNKD